MLDNPAADVIKSIPAVWDETIVLPESRIGELSIFARRKGDMWMLAVMSGSKGGKINVPLSFLGDGKYHAMLVKDNMEKPDAVVLEEQIRHARLHGPNRQCELAADFWAGSSKSRQRRT